MHSGLSGAWTKHTKVQPRLLISAELRCKIFSPSAKSPRTNSGGTERTIPTRWILLYYEWGCWFGKTDQKGRSTHGAQRLNQAENISRVKESPMMFILQDGGARCYRNQNIGWVRSLTVCVKYVNKRWKTTFDRQPKNLNPTHKKKLAKKW